jgi:hypothetical protein
MPEYLVTWSIEVDADNPEDAARKAMETQQRPDSIAHSFVVQADADDPGLIVDLDEIDGRV